MVARYYLVADMFDLVADLVADYTFVDTVAFCIAANKTKFIT